MSQVSWLEYLPCKAFEDMRSANCLLYMPTNVTSMNAKHLTCLLACPWPQHQTKLHVWGHGLAAIARMLLVQRRTSATCLLPHSVSKAERSAADQTLSSTPGSLLTLASMASLHLTCHPSSVSYATHALTLPLTWFACSVLLPEPAEAWTKIMQPA